MALCIYPLGKEVLTGVRGELVAEPLLAEHPVARHSSFGNSQSLSNLRDLHSLQNLHLDDAAQPGTETSKLFEQIVNFLQRDLARLFVE